MQCNQQASIVNCVAIVVKSARGPESFTKHLPDARPVILSMDNFPLFSENPKNFLAAL